MASTKLTRLVLLIVAFLIVVSDANAQTICEMHTASDVDVCRQTVIQAGPFSGKAIYNSETATVNNNVELLLYLQGDGVEAVAKAKCESVDEPAIRCDEALPISQRIESPPTVLFKLRVSINEGVEPKAHQLTLTFSYKGENLVSATKPLLYVGIRKQDQNKPKVAFETGLKTAPVIYTGIENTLPLTIINEYREYAVNIHSISIESDPSHLIKPGTLAYQHPNATPQESALPKLNVPPQGQSLVYVPVKANWLNFTTLIGGFSSPQLVLNVTYDDSQGHKVSFRQNVAVNFRPRDRVLGFAMFLGVLAGALVKLYLQRLQQTGQITRRQVLVFVVTTMSIGLVVAVIAMVGKFQIIAFETTGSYDRPVVIFAIALAGAVGGAQILSMWFKKEPASK